MEQDLRDTQEYKDYLKALEYENASKQAYDDAVRERRARSNYFLNKHAKFKIGQHVRYNGTDAIVVAHQLGERFGDGNVDWKIACILRKRKKDGTASENNCSKLNYDWGVLESKLTAVPFQASEAR